MVISIDEYHCIGCGGCILICPNKAIALNGDNLAIVDSRLCNNCGDCISICPTEAILIELT